MRHERRRVTRPTGRIMARYHTAIILTAPLGASSCDEKRGLIMGKLIYDGVQKTDIEDRALTHLQLVMTAKLRRGEPFAFTWKEDASTGGGRTTVWVHAQSSLAFKYAGSRPPAVNRAWVDALAYTANAPTGLYLVPEPANTSPATATLEVVP